MTNDNEATFQALRDAQQKIDRLKAENFQLKGELGSIRSGSSKVLRFKEQEIKALRADNVRLAAALSQARLQTISLREAGHAAMRTDYAGEAVGDVNEGDAAAFYLEGFEAAVKEIRKVDVTTALRDLLGPVESCLSEMRDACAAACRVIARHGLVGDFEAEANTAGVGEGFGVRAQEQIARLRAAMADKP